MGRIGRAVALMLGALLLAATVVATGVLHIVWWAIKVAT